MARYYKQAQPQFIDYSITAPAEMLMSVIQEKDKQTDEVLALNEAVKTTLKTREEAGKSGLGQGGYLSGDEDRYSNVISGFEGEIDTISKEILKNPFEANKYRNKIGDVRGRVSASISAGELYNMNKNYTTAQEFIENNKGKDPATVAAIYKKTMDEFGSTYDDEGKAQRLSFPGMVYDEKLNKRAESYAKAQGDKKANQENRIDLVLTSMMNDHDIYNTVAQRLDYGMIKDKNGSIIDASGMEIEEKNVIIRDAMKWDAELAVANTQQRPDKPKGADKKPLVATGTEGKSRRGTGVTVSSSIGTATIDYPKLSVSEAVTKSISDYDVIISNPATSKIELLDANIEKGILQSELAAAQSYADKKMESFSFIRDDSQGTSSSTAKEQYKNEYLSNRGISETASQEYGWNENYTTTDQKQIEEDLKNFFGNKARMQNAYFASTSPDLNGIQLKTTWQELEDNTTLERTIAAVNGKKVVKGYLKQTESWLHEREKLGEISNLESVKDKNRWTFTYKVIKPAIESVEIKDKVNTETYNIVYGEGYDNFEWTGTEILPTKTSDKDGNVYFKKDAIFNGEAIEMLISSNQVGSTTFNDGMMRMNDITKTTYLTDATANNMYNRIMNSDIKEGGGYMIDDDVRVTRRNGKIILVTDDGSIIESDKIATFLSIRMMPK